MVKHLANNVRILRARAKLSNAGLAAMAGVSNTTVTRAEHGRLIKPISIKRLANYFNVSEYDLLNKDLVGISQKTHTPDSDIIYRAPLKLRCESCGDYMYTMGRSRSKRYCHQCNGNKVATDA